LNKAAIVETPLMKQYMQIKSKHPDAILLFRVGDFYETFSDDAILTSKILGITLTRRANGAAQYIELAGFPYHSLDTYLPKLVRAGQRVAICEQLEDPSQTKKLVRRGVTELVTPGVAFNDTILQNKENNFLACVHLDKKIVGVAFLDISTGEFLCAEGTIDYIDKLLSNFQPKEVLYERSKESQFTEQFSSKYYTFKFDDWAFKEEAASERLMKHFETTTLKGFGVHAMPYGITAAGAILHYLDLTEHKQIDHIRSISRIEEGNHVWLDRFTARNLELYGTVNEGGKSLVEVLDKTITPMGSRMLKRWIALPLKDVVAINNRLSVVEYMLKEEQISTDITENVKHICDLERVISRVAAQRILPREIVQLRLALEAIEPIKQQCLATNNQFLLQIGDRLNPCKAISDRIEKEIRPDTSNVISKGSVINDGVDADLDELRQIAFAGKDFLLKIQQREEERTGIKLKISFNNVFGYYIEVRNTYKDRVPAEWIRKQTLVDAERYITQELKEYESKIFGAEEKILTIETRIFNNLVSSLAEYIEAIQLNANLIAQLDCLLSFAKVSYENNYCKPVVTDTLELDIKDGRHPVIETVLPIGEPYIPNDVFLDCEKQQIIIITGPNMAGKSALLRQVALITLMAQCGCFVPAKAAKIGVVDKIFTRVGASDNISQGESTFMVEMTEAASILNNITNRSLILLDELGRGTSTYDGISIAWAIVEYLHEHPTVRPKTMFATHYHELNEMENSFGRVKNFNITIKELNNKVIFLRKFVRGGSEHSFGIHVAKMAGMPQSVVNRANEILADLEKTHKTEVPSKPVADIASHRSGYQLSIFQLDDPVLEQIKDEIKNLDINNITPIEALNKLSEIRKLIGIKK